MKITRVEALQIETLGYYEHLSGHVLVKVHAKTVNQAVDFFEVLHALTFRCLTTKLTGGNGAEAEWPSGAAPC